MPWIVPDKGPKPDLYFAPDSGCLGGTTRCGILCVDLKSDPKHCGGCNKPCAVDEDCSSGKCCKKGLTNCGSVCANTLTSPQHCGTCGQPCFSGNCSYGKCCAAGETNCNGLCINLMLSSLHCGACNNPCSGTCSNGKCCPTGETSCGGICVNLQTSGQHCGTCNNPCSGTCSNGKCCPTGETSCGGTCVNTQTSGQHCGQCNNPCSGTCSNGKCCPTGETSCGGICVNTQTSSQHCGKCNNPCGRASSCVSGQCGTTRTTVACASGTEDQAFGNGMRGCKGQVTFDKRATLCASGFGPCSVLEWVQNRGSTAPSFNYWTEDVLYAHYAGQSGYCFVSTVKLYYCGASSPMRVCSGPKDSLGNTCNWIGCGYNAYQPSQYLGGCNGDLHAGTLCCPKP